MSVLQSIFLGVIQGLTEFLPVSSSGHLSVFQNIFGMETDAGALFDILLHLATVGVILLAFHSDVGKLFLALFGIIRDFFAKLSGKGKREKTGAQSPRSRIINNNYRKFLVLLIVSTIPTGIIGVAGRKLVQDASGTLIVPGICLLITAVILFCSDTIPEGEKIPRDITYREALIIGIVQGFATLPGISRSGSTITACLICGMSRRFSVKYSFLMSVPAVLGAALLELMHVEWSVIDSTMMLTYLAGMAAAALVGWLSFRTMLAVVKNRRFRYFAYYCFAVGIFAIAGQFIFMN